MNAYIIQSTAFDFPLYVSRSSDPTQQMARLLNDAKVWKTAAGAEKWLADRGGYPGRVITATCTIRRSGRLVAESTR